MPDFRRYPNEGFPYFVTTNVKDGRALFLDAACCQVVLDCISHLRTGLRHQVHAYVLMPNHLHLITTPKEDSNISQVMHSLKLFTSRRIGDMLGLRGGIWQARFYERALRNAKDVENAFSFVHENPVKASLVSRPEEYVWSSYRASVLGEATPTVVDQLVL